MQDVILSPSDFVALVNQTFEFAFPIIAIEGEVSEFRISKNRWVYFNLKDDVSVVKFFGTVYQMPGPLEDGMMVRVMGSPRLHEKFGFSVTVQSVVPVGQGSIKKAADLLRIKLEKEGLFALERKRLLPKYPVRVGLVTAGTSAAYADFIKIAAERWGGVEITLADVHVQGEQAPGLIIEAIEKLNMLSNPLQVIVIIRGGGSAEDLAAFNDERVVRAVAASRIPTVVAIGHEVDESLAELAADLRASTPSNAAQLIFPDKKHELSNLKSLSQSIQAEVLDLYIAAYDELNNGAVNIRRAVQGIFDFENQRLASSLRLVKIFNPAEALKRGYAIVRKDGELITSINQVKISDSIDLNLSDGTIRANISKVEKEI